MKGLVEFVRYARNVYCNMCKGKAIDIVIGNSGGDMDSVISSIGYSYFSYLKDESRIIFPVVSFPRDELKLRRDIEFALKKVGLEDEDLIFYDELLQDYNHGNNNNRQLVNITLVDHNEIDQQGVKNIVANGNGVICGIIDHHVDLMKYMDAKPRIVEKCGSCSSLVFDYWRDVFSERYGEIDDNTKDLKMKELQFLLTAIAIDTDNLTHRVEETDRSVYKKLFEKWITRKELNCLGEEVKAEKLNISGLSMYDLLRKDYKEYEYKIEDRITGKLGISSIASSFSRLFKIYGHGCITEAVFAWSKDKGLTKTVIMTSDVDEVSGQFERGIAFFPPTGISSHLIESLKLQSPNTVDNSLLVYKQLDLSKSRKVVAPVILQVLDCTAD